MARTPQQRQRARARAWFETARAAAIDPDAEVFFARAGVLGPQQRGHIERLSAGIKATLSIGRLADHFDVLCVATETQAASLTNLAKKAHDATIVNTVTFTARRGFTGNGSDSYLNTNCTLSAATRYAQNSAHMMVYSRTSRTESATYKALMAVTHSSGVRLCRIIPIGVDGNSRVSNNHDGADSWTTNPANEQGLHIVDRRTSTAFRWLQNNALKAERSVTSSGVPAFPPFVLAASTGGTPSLFSDSEVAAWSIGKAFASDAQAFAFGSLIETYLDAIGAGVL